jgi:hypothetical protein
MLKGSYHRSTWQTHRVAADQEIVMKNLILAITSAFAQAAVAVIFANGLILPPQTEGARR